MAYISVAGGNLHVELSFADKLWSIHGSFTIRLGNVTGASITKPPTFFESLKLIGTNLPGGKMAGSYFFHNELVFFDYNGDEDAILVVDLAHEKYKHLLVHIDEPDTPKAAVARIMAALAEHS